MVTDPSVHVQIVDQFISRPQLLKCINSNLSMYGYVKKEFKFCLTF
jgi:hypothetical protein